MFDHTCSSSSSNLNVESYDIALDANGLPVPVTVMLHGTPYTLTFSRPSLHDGDDGAVAKGVAAAAQGAVAAKGTTAQGAAAQVAAAKGAFAEGAFAEGADAEGADAEGAAAEGDVEEGDVEEGIVAYDADATDPSETDPSATPTFFNPWSPDFQTWVQRIRLQGACKEVVFETTEYISFGFGIKTPNNNARGLSDDEMLDGVALCYMDPIYEPHTVQITIFCTEGTIGRICTRLLAAVEAFVKRHLPDVTVLYLNVRDDEKVIAWYEAHGFTRRPMPVRTLSAEHKTWRVNKLI